MQLPKGGEGLPHGPTQRDPEMDRTWSSEGLGGLVQEGLTRNLSQDREWMHNYI